jgi:large subunit ribosomal protein L18e
VKRTGPTNFELRRLIHELRKAGRAYNAPAWRYVAELLAKPTRKRVAVNLSKINRYAREGEVVVVPGKVLGAGRLEKKVTIAAYAFSAEALRKIREAGGRALTLKQLLEENRAARGVRIIV